MPENLIDRSRGNYSEIRGFLNSEAVAATQYNLDGSVNFVHSFLGRTSPLPDYDLMADSSSPRSKNSSGFNAGYYPSSPCFHMKMKLSEIGPIYDWGSLPGDPYFQLRYDVGGRAYVWLNESLLQNLIGPDQWMGGGFSLRVPSDLRSSLAEQAFNYFSDVFPTKLSLAEFIQGFTQLSSLLPKLESSITKTIGSGYLNKTFGWDNLLSDLDTISSGVDTIIARMDYLHRTFGIPTRLGFARGDVYTPNFESFVHHDYGGVVNQTRIALHSYKVDFRATCWIYQHLDFIHDFVGFLRVMVGALGLNNPVKAFWNTVPLSFVVDWFFNISQHLDNLTRINPAMGWDVTNVTHSFTYSFEWEVSPVRYNGGVNLQSYIVPATVYERGIGLSFPWELLNPEELSPTQLTLLLAMLHQLG